MQHTNLSHYSAMDSNPQGKSKFAIAFPIQQPPNGAPVLLDKCSARTKALLAEEKALKFHLQDLNEADRHCWNRLQCPAGDLGHEMVARHAEMLVVAEHYKAAKQNAKNSFMEGELAKYMRGHILKSAEKQGGGPGPYRLPSSKDFYLTAWGSQIGKKRVERTLEKVLRWAERKGWQVEFAVEGENAEVDGKDEEAKVADGAKATDEVEE